MFGRKIIRYETIGSTNEALKELAQSGAGPGQGPQYHDVDKQGETADSG